MHGSASPTVHNSRARPTPPPRGASRRRLKLVSSRLVSSGRISRSRFVSLRPPRSRPATRRQRHVFSSQSAGLACARGRLLRQLTALPAAAAPVAAWSLTKMKLLGLLARPAAVAAAVQAVVRVPRAAVAAHSPRAALALAQRQLQHGAAAADDDDACDAQGMGRGAARDR